MYIKSKFTYESVTVESHYKVETRAIACCFCNIIHYRFGFASCKNCLHLYQIVATSLAGDEIDNCVFCLYQFDGRVCRRCTNLVTTPINSPRILVIRGGNCMYCSKTYRRGLIACTDCIPCHCCNHDRGHAPLNKLAVPCNIKRCVTFILFNRTLGYLRVPRPLVMKILKLI